MTVNAVWTGKADPLIAECAEALGIDTELVMAVHPRNDRVCMALFTPQLEGEHVWAALLRRDEDDVLQVVRQDDTGKTFAEFIDPSRGLG